MMKIEHFVEWGKNNPKKLFQIDGFGAILSAILLGIVLVKLESVFGIPISTLYFLASLPCFFALYDFYCYYNINKNLGVLLKGIASMNFIYCYLSIGIVIYHREVIKILGWLYILLEVAIVSLLALIELRVATKQNVRKSI